MSNIACFGFVDTSRATATYVLKHKQALIEWPAPGRDGVSFLDLIQDGEEAAILEEWKSARALLHKVKTTLASGTGRRLVNAHVLAIAPGGIIQWNREEVPNPDTFARVHLCLLPSPGAIIYAGSESVVLNVGVPTFVGHRVPVSEINLDPQHAVHKLVLETELVPDA